MILVEARDFFSHLLWSNSYTLGSWMLVSIQGVIYLMELY